MADNAPAKGPSPLIKFFLPGMALGVVVGGLVGAYVTPRLVEAPPDIPIKAGGAPRAASTQTPAEREGLRPPERDQPAATKTDEAKPPAEPEKKPAPQTEPAPKPPEKHEATPPPK